MNADLAVDGGDLAGDHRGCSVEVEVVPMEAECFAASAAGGGEEDPGWEVATVGDEGDEPVELVAGPDVGSALAGGADRGWGGGVGHVEGDSVPAEGVLECGMENRVDVPHRSRGEAGWMFRCLGPLLSAAVM